MRRINNACYGGTAYAPDEERYCSHRKSVIGYTSGARMKNTTYSGKEYCAGCSNVQRIRVQKAARVFKR